MIVRTSFLLAWNVYIKFALNVSLYTLYTSTLHFSRKQEIEELNGSVCFQKVRGIAGWLLCRLWNSIIKSYTYSQMVLRTLSLWAWMVYMDLSLHVPCEIFIPHFYLSSRDFVSDSVHGSARLQIQCNDYTISLPPLGFDQKAESRRRWISWNYDNRPPMSFVCFSSQELKSQCCMVLLAVQKQVHTWFDFLRRPGARMEGLCIHSGSDVKK
jgi:hypothetical protein